MILREMKIWKVVNREEKKPDPNNEIYTPQSTAPAFGQLVTYQQDLDAYEAKVDKANATLFANITQTIVNEHKTINYLQFSGLPFKSDMLLKQSSVE